MALADSTGAVTDRWEYSAYGTEISTGTADTPFRFHGGLGCMTDANGLVYMRARYYNPRTMRFLNADPIGFAGGMNWYVFVGNNPMVSTDPNGLIEYKIDENNKTITLHFRIQFFFEGGALDGDNVNVYGMPWSKLEMEAYAKEYANSLEKAWNGSNIRIYPVAGGSAYKPLVKIETKIGGWWWDDIELEVVKLRPTARYRFRSYVTGYNSLFGLSGRMSTDDILLEVTQLFPNGSSLKQVTSTHEFGHMIGLQHPSHGVKGVGPNTRGEYMDRQLTPAQRSAPNAPLSKSIMGGGMELRPEHFLPWVESLNKMKACRYEAR